MRLDNKEAVMKVRGGFWLPLLAVGLFWIFVGVCFAKSHTIVEIPDQDEKIENNIRKYDVTTYKDIKDIKEESFTVIDKVERIDIHQLEYDIAQEQKKIDEANEVILNSPARIAELNKMIGEIREMSQ